ncbi:MAG TPA: hypothetical protein PKI94_04625 [Candidatus Gastranaerophilaceae bacterium]|nr:hypothetical protein [Candidatus Gastranaerophilaceae bacterium]
MKDKIKVVLNKILQVCSIIFKTLACIVLTYFILILPITAIRTGKFDWQIFIIIVVCFLFAFLTNWAILKKGCLRKILMFFVLFLICAVLEIKMLHYLGIESDYCIEDGDCKEGRIVNTEKYGKVLINKENCLKYNWEWYEKQKYCKLWN